MRTLDGHFQPGCVGMGHSKGERLLAAARPPTVPELPVALRVERRICFDVTQLKLREKAMELLEKVGRIWEFFGKGRPWVLCVFFFSFSMVWVGRVECCHFCEFLGEIGRHLFYQFAKASDIGSFKAGGCLEESLGCTFHAGFGGVSTGMFGNLPINI